MLKVRCETPLPEEHLIDIPLTDVKKKQTGIRTRSATMIKIKLLHIILRFFSESFVVLFWTVRENAKKNMATKKQGQIKIKQEHNHHRVTTLGNFAIFPKQGYEKSARLIRLMSVIYFIRRSDQHRTFPQSSVYAEKLYTLNIQIL